MDLTKILNLRRALKNKLFELSGEKQRQFMEKINNMHYEGNNAYGVMNIIPKFTRLEGSKETVEAKLVKKRSRESDLVNKMFISSNVYYGTLLPRELFLVEGQSAVGPVIDMDFSSMYPSAFGSSPFKQIWGFKDASRKDRRILRRIKKRFNINKRIKVAMFLKGELYEIETVDNTMYDIEDGVVINIKSLNKKS